MLGTRGVRSLESAPGGERLRGAGWFPLRAEDEGARRRELVLTSYLLVLLALGVCALMGVLLGGAGGTDLLLRRLPVVAGWNGVVLLLLRDARRGRLRRASIGGLSLLAVAGLACAVSWTNQLPATILLSALFIALVASLLEGWSAHVSIGGYLAALTLIDVVQFAGAFPGAESWMSDGRDLGNSLVVMAMLAGLSLALLTILRERQTPIGQIVSAAPDRSPLARSRTGELSVRETEVTKLVAAGKTDKQIAEELFISFRTVGTHVGNALRKTGCSNRTELALLAAQEGLVEPGSARPGSQ